MRPILSEGVLAEAGGGPGIARWHGRSLQAKVVALTVSVVLPIMGASTILTVWLSRSALENDIRNSGLTLARELALSAAPRVGARGETVLQQEVESLLGRGSLVRDVAVYVVRPHGLEVIASGGLPPRLSPEEEIAAREDQEVVVQNTRDGNGVLRVAVPIQENHRSIGVVSLGLPLDRVNALSRQQARQAIGLGAVVVVLVIGSLSAFMNHALTKPVRGLLRVMQRAEAGDLEARAPENRRDEVGRVAWGLNRMLDRIGSFQAELARRVQEATAELRATNQRLFAAQQEVARNERLAAAGELAAAMAHDVGTPLTGVSGHLQLLAEEVADPPLQERLGRIQKQVDRAVAAARRFLEVARPPAARVPVDLQALLQDLLVLISPETQRKGVTVTAIFAERLPLLCADPHRLQELFLNLLTNALEVLGSGGTLQLAVHPARLEGDAPGLNVTVSDNGPGMPPETLARAFEPFFTTRATTGGTGLGLAIARRIAREHGGVIHLESAPGQGTRATVQLPAAPA